MKDFVRDAVARSRLLEEKHPEVVFYYCCYRYWFIWKWEQICSF